MMGDGHPEQAGDQEAAAPGVEPLVKGPQLVTERLELLRQLLPEAFAEGQIDVKELQSSLGEFTSDSPETYAFSWSGKREAIQLLQVPSRGSLFHAKEQSLNPEATGNIYVEGDNLEVLKLLYRSYFGRVKMIYLDPPYNKRNDLIYRDSLKDPLDAYLVATGQKDDNGNLLTSNPETAGRFHSAWLSMMYPRLFLARQLLRPDGVLFVSCNDIEQANLKRLLTSIFDEENFLATLIWNNEGNIDNQSKIKTNHEYIHMFARDIRKFERPSVIDPNIEESSKLYKDEIENSITKNGPANPPSKVFLPAGFPAVFDSGTVAKQVDKYPYVYSDAKVAKSVLTKAVTVESGWSSRNLLQLFIDNGFEPIQDAEGKETRFALTETGAIYGYKKRSEEQGHVLTVIRNVGTTKQNSLKLAKWGLHFDWPKPVMLIRYLCAMTTKNDDIVLDFFAGSSTTAHAVMRLNREDGGGRRFIMVQLPEPIPETAKAHKAGFRTISEMGIERIRKSIEELDEESSARLDLGERETPEDLGFRVFRLGESNFRRWRGVEDLDENEYIEQLTAFTDPLVEGWDVESILWEVVLLEGYPLTSRFESVQVGDNTVWKVIDPEAEKRFFVCLDDALEPDVLSSLDLNDEDVFVCRDSAATDTIVANLAVQCRLKTV